MRAMSVEPSATQPTARSTRPRTAERAENGVAEPSDPASDVRRFSIIAVAALVGLAATYWVLVGTETGQRLENLALRGAELRTESARQAGLDRLAQVSVATFALSLIAVVVIGIVRRRATAAVIVAGAMGGSVVVVEALKAVLDRPALVDGPAWLLRNSFPSGSAAVATAIAVGAILVSPDRLRWAVVPIAVAYAAIVGEAIQTSGWHRLSDTIGAVLIVIATSSTALAVLARAELVTRTSFGRIDRRVRRLLLAGSLTILGIAAAILAFGALFPLLTSPDGSRRALLQTAFPLLGMGLTAGLIVGFAAAIEPYSIGRRRAPEAAAAVDVAGHDRDVTGSAEHSSR